MTGQQQTLSRGHLRARTPPPLTVHPPTATSILWSVWVSLAASWSNSSRLHMTPELCIGQWAPVRGRGLTAAVLRGAVRDFWLVQETAREGEARGVPLWSRPSE